MKNAHHEVPKKISTIQMHYMNCSEGKRSQTNTIMKACPNMRRRLLIFEKFIFIELILSEVKYYIT